MQKPEEICRWKLEEIFVDFPIQSKAEWHSASKGVVEDLKFLFWMHRMLVYKRGTIKVYVKYTGNSGPEKKKLIRKRQNDDGNHQKHLWFILDL